MKWVKITGTAYGLHDRKRIILKDRRSEPFLLDDKEAERLVSLGVAETVKEGLATAENGENEAGTVKHPQEKENRAEGTAGTFKGKARSSRYDESTKVSELREIGKSFGLTFPVRMSKAKMIEQLDAFFANLSDGVPELSAAEPVL